MSPFPSTRLFALDWGTSTARAYRIGPIGDVLERREAPLGILQVGSGAFDAALLTLLGDWAGDPAPRIACGMIGSRQGWIEVPYADCPADVATLAAGLANTPGGELAIVPGLACRDDAGVPDVMRGEETQIAGAIGDDEPCVVAVLPGTHSKWARVERGRITGFSTYMTGELFAVLLAHSLLGRLAAARPAAATGSSAFADGVARGLAGVGLSHAIFGARSKRLLGELAADHVGDWLSGVLIGDEIAAARRWTGADLERLAPVRVIGSDALAQSYRQAFGVAGLAAEAAGADAAAHGLFRIAQLARLC